MSASRSSQSAEPLPNGQRPPLRVAVVGVGAIGGLFGARLVQAGADVTFVARGATLVALRAQGLHVESIDGDVALPQVRATDSATDVGPVDAVLVGVKTWQVPDVAAGLGPMVGAQTLVVPLQNGVESGAQLASAVGPGHVVDGLCRVIAEQTGPGRIKHAAAVPTVAFGERAGDPLGAPVRDAAARLRAALAAGGVTVEAPDDVPLAVWEKFLFIAPLGTVGAAARVPFGEMMASADCRAVLDACCREVMAVGHAAGVALTEASLASVWRLYDGLPAGGTASMQRDLLAGRPSELDAQPGAVRRLGRAHGVPTPVHDTLYAILAPQEARARR